MGQLNTAILVLFIIILGVSLTDAINCYSCNSANPNCKDPFDKTKFNSSNYVVTDSSNTRCGKTVVLGSVQRGAFNASLCGNPDGCQILSLAGVQIGTCCCSSELCNGVSSIQQQHFILFSIINAFTTFIYHSF